MFADPHGFLYPRIDPACCVSCGRCREVCPVLHSELCKNDVPQQVFAAYNTDDNVLKGSSSGGVFPALAHGILEQKGIVFGASYHGPTCVVHSSADTLDKCARFSTSKYVQSDIGSTYVEARRALESGHKVLYSGTPCQIAGLKSFCGREYENLFTCDIVCHGVGSPRHYADYIAMLEKRHGSRVNAINMKDKRKGWLDSTIRVELADGRVLDRAETQGWKSLFMEGFVLRSSCFDCRFCTAQRVGDVTIGDYWGIRKTHPEFYNPDGVSLLLVNSEKGEQLLKRIESRLRLRSSSFDLAAENNPNLRRATAVPPRYDEVSSALRDQTLENVLRRFFTPPPLHRLWGALKRICRISKG